MTRPHALLMAGVLLVFYLDGFVLGAPVALLLVWALLGVVVLVGFLRHAGHGPAGRVQWPEVALAALAALGVLALTRGASASVVLATALVGAAGGALEAAGRSRHRWQGVAAPVYCGAFAGMTSELVLGHPAWVVLAGGLAGLVLSVLSDSWSGIGGKLGTIAFLGGARRHGSGPGLRCDRCRRPSACLYRGRALVGADRLPALSATYL